MPTAAVKLNKLTKLCKQHTLRTFISKHALARLNNTPGRTRSLCSFASYPKQFYTSWFNFKATQVRRMHGPTSTGNWRTYKQLGTVDTFMQYSSFRSDERRCRKSDVIRDYKSLKHVLCYSCV